MYYFLLPFIYIKLQLKYTYSYILKYLLYKSLNIPFLKLNRIDVFTNTIYFDFVYINKKYKEYIGVDVGENRLVFSYFTDFLCDYYKKFLSEILSDYDKNKLGWKLTLPLSKSLVIDHLCNVIVINVNTEEFTNEWLKYKNLSSYITTNDFTDDSLLRTAIQSQKTKIELYSKQNIIF